MTEKERREIENLPMPGVDSENDFLLIGGFQTLNQYLKHYWLWKNREFFEDTGDYKCTENIREIRKSREKISDSRFERIVDARNISKSPVISSPKGKIRDLEEELERKLNLVIGDIKLPSGTIISGYNFLTCNSEECRKMLREKGIEEYNASTCPLTVDNRYFFTWLLSGDLPFKREKGFRGFKTRMKREGMSLLEDGEILKIVGDGLTSLASNPQLLFTENMALKRLREIFPYDKNSASEVKDNLEWLTKTVESLNSGYPHDSSNNVLIFKLIAGCLKQCEEQIEYFGRHLDKETREEHEEKVERSLEELREYFKKENIE